jgi:hypothetical protein
MVEISKSGSGAGPGRESSRGYSTPASARTMPGHLALSRCPSILGSAARGLVSECFSLNPPSTLMKRTLLASLGALLLCSSAFSQGSDACGSAQSISGLGIFNFDTLAATTDGSPNALCDKFGTDQISDDVWFNWTAPANGDYQVTTCNWASNDTKIAIYDGPNCVTANMVDCNDDTCGLQSTVQANGLVSGSSYLIRIGSFAVGAGGNAQFEVLTPPVGPPNDDCVNATPIAGNGFFNFDNTVASTDGAPNSLCYKFGSSEIPTDVWYEWTCPANDSYHVTTCNLTSVDTKIAIYDGPSCAANMLDCNDDTCGLQSEVFGSNLVAGNSYLIRVGTFPSAAGGVGQFEVGPAVPPMPPPNDDCINAEVLPGCGQFIFDNGLATIDGLPDGMCYEFGTSQIDHDVWFSFTAPTSATYEFSLCSTGTSVDSKIAVYADQGVCPPSPAIDCDDDIQCTIVAGPSKVTWAATGGSTYLLRLGTFPGAAGGTGLFDVIGCGTGIGTNYCISTVNSTGTPATMSAAGSASISTNNLTLIASSVPDVPGIGIFIAGPGSAILPFYDGFLCVAQVGLQRINQITPPVSGVVTQMIDYTGASTGTAPLNVVAGASYFYQHWMRDPGAGGTGANFTDGLEIMHTP